MIYQHIAIDDGADRFGRIDQGNTDTTYGRVGARLVQRVDHPDGQALTAWLRVNLWQAFSDEATTTFSAPSGNFPVALHTDLGGSWGQAGVGVSGKVRRNLEVFVSADYNLAFDQGTGHGTEARVGLNWAW